MRVALVAPDSQVRTIQYEVMQALEDVLEEIHSVLAPT